MTTVKLISQINKQTKFNVTVIYQELNNVLTWFYTTVYIFQDSGSPYNFPMFSSFPVPREYSPNLGGRSAMKQGEASALMSASPLTALGVTVGSDSLKVCQG